MTTTELKQRITKKEEQIKKLEKKLQKWENNKTSKEAFEKEYNWLPNFEERKVELAVDWVERCDKEIRYTNTDLKEAKETLTKYNNMLAVEIQKENSINELPELFNDFQQYLVNNWDEYDRANKNYLKAQYNKLGHREFVKNYGRSGYEKMYQTDEEIHKTNVKNARTIILDLINRVSAKTGKITDYKGLRLNQNNMGYTILNGFVKGENGTATVESILAGGYNIQRLHIRVLVK